MTNIDERLDNLRKATGMDIFEMPRGKGAPGGFAFTIPGVMIGAKDIEIVREPGEWVLTWTCPETYHVYRGHNDSLDLAYLDLIAARMGTNGIIARPLRPVDGEKRFGDYGGKS